MFLLPDLQIIKFCILEHPFFYFPLFAILLIISAYYFKFAWLTTGSLVRRSIYFLLVLSALSQFLLVSCLLLAYYVIILICNGELSKKKNIQLVLLTLLFMMLLTMGWTFYITLLDNYYPTLQMSVIEILCKLYNYPRIYFKVIFPILKQGLLYEVAFSFAGMIMIGVRLLRDSRNEWNFGLGVICFMILVTFCGVGISKTYYSHVRYFYFIYPLLLMFCGILVALLWNMLTQRRIEKFVLAILFISFSLFQIHVSWTRVVNAVPGKEEMYSWSRTYLDNKTCCEYLESNRGKNDHVIAFASAHQSSVYCGAIDACIRPKLREYEGQQYHYITGSRFFDTRNELILLLKAYMLSGQRLWIVVSKRHVRPGTWEYPIIKEMRKHTVCEATDNNTSLIRISTTEFLNLIELLPLGL